MAICCLVAIIMLLNAAWVHAQSANDGFNVTVDSNVLCSAVQPDGKILIGGDFATVNGQPRSRLARLFVDGSIDASFVDPGTNNSVTSIVVQADGRVVIGGAFTQVGAYQRNRLARLDSSGTVDARFNPNANGTVRGMALQPDGKLLLAGDFTGLGPSNETHNYLARLNADGSPDSAYMPTANQSAISVALQLNGKAIFGGAFTAMNGQTTNRVARINTDGSLDFNFAVSGPINNAIQAVAVQASGKILIGGSFTTVNGVSRPYLARFTSTGLLDSFNPAPDDFVYSFAIQPDGRLLVGGNFFNITGVPRAKIARFNIDDSLDPSFAPPYTSTAYITASARTLAVEADGRIMVGGTYTPFASAFSAIGRLNSDGSLDRAFNPNANNIVTAFALQPDGKILLGGFFTTLNGVATARNYVARLNVDGSVDAAFNPNMNSVVRAITMQPDRKILLGGDFTTLNGGAITRNNIARLNADGSVDATFDPHANNSVRAIAVQPDGKILLGGDFATLNGGAIGRYRIARLNANGSVDTTFDPNVNSSVTALAIQPDGRILIGGFFSTLNGGASVRNRVARLNADGSIDANFNPNASDTVWALAVQPDGKILLGGNFTTLNGTASARNKVARLNADGSVDTAFNPNANDSVFSLAVQPDGKILLAGIFTTFNGGASIRNRAARLNADGSVDASFDPNVNGIVYALAVQPDGRIVLGGDFSTVNGGASARILGARLSTQQPALQSLQVNGGTVIWRRSGAGPELALPPQLELSFDGSFYGLAGTMQRISGGWQYSGLLQPSVGQVFYLRARASVAGGYGNGSQSLIESVGQFVGNDRIFGDGFESQP